MFSAATDSWRRNTQYSLTGRPSKTDFDIFGINIFSFFGDDHVFLAAEKLQVAACVEAAQVAGHQPSVHDRFRGHFRIVEILRHHGLAAHGHFADAFGVGIRDANLDARQRLAHCVRAKWFEIIQRDGRAGLGAAVAVADRNAQVVEKLQGRWLGERAADEQGAQFAAERLVYLPQQRAAERRSRLRSRERAIDADQRVEQLALCWRQRVEFFAAVRARDFSAPCGTRLMYVILYRVNASRTNSGRSVRRCTTVRRIRTAR